MFNEINGRNLSFEIDWNQVSELPSGKSTFVALSYGDKLGLVGGGNDTVLTSSDLGKTWESTTVTGFVADDKFDTTIYGGVASPNHVYKSTDGGSTWKSVYTVQGSADGFKAVHC